MNTIAENLQVIYDIKENIKTAIESKGVGVGDAPFTNYADKITEITVGGGESDCSGVYDNGYNDGYGQGYINGYNNGSDDIINSAKTIEIKNNGRYLAKDNQFYKEIIVSVYDEGKWDYDTGYNDGFTNGYGEGYDNGFDKGYTSGYTDGYDYGISLNEGGYDDGYTSGYADGLAVNAGDNVIILKESTVSAFENLEFKSVFSIDCSKVFTLSFLFHNTTFPNDQGFILNNTENVTGTESMYLKSNIKKPLLFNTRNVREMRTMFDRCYELQEIPQYTTIAVESFYRMFAECGNLITVPQLNCTNLKMTYNTEPTSGMFYQCTNLTNLGGFVGLTFNLDLSASDLITRESMLNVFNTIGIVEDKTIDISQAVYDRLTSEDIQIATNKGWIINIK